MITYTADLSKNADKMEGEFSFKGMAADTKPTESIDGITIKNGSSFLEMDTKEMSFYDAAGKQWV